MKEMACQVNEWIPHTEFNNDIKFEIDLYHINFKRMKKSRFTVLA